MYIRILNKHNVLIKSLFLIIWFFLIFRITSYIDLPNHILKLNFRKWIFSLADFSSIIILICLFIYLLICLKIYKKISITALLIIYPIFGLIGYLLIDIKNQFQDTIVWHHFITLCSAFLFFTIIEYKKIFGYQFKVFLLKIILTIVLLYFLIYFLPTLIIGIYLKQDLRITQKIVFAIFNNQFYIEQNVNGSTRICIILLITSLILFKKFILKKKVIAHIFFLISLFLIFFIYLLQSRLNILVAFFFSLLLLFSTKNLNVKKKLIYFSIIITVPLFISNIFFKQKSRFYDNTAHLNYEEIFLEQKNIYNNLIDASTFRQNTDLNQNNIIEIINKNKENIKDLSYKDFLILNNFITEGNKIPYFSHDQHLHLAKKFLILHKDALLNYCSSDWKFFDGFFTGRICGWEILLKNNKTKDLLYGKGFFYDQVYLKFLEKTSSNSWVNILFNAGIFALLAYLIFIFVILSFFFKIKNVNHKNIYISISHYLFIYFLTRSLFEDTLAFVSIDFLIFFISISIIKETKKKII